MNTTAGPDARAAARVPVNHAPDDETAPRDPSRHPYHQPPPPPPAPKAEP